MGQPVFSGPSPLANQNGLDGGIVEFYDGSQNGGGNVDPEVILARYIIPNIPEDPNESFNPGEGWEARPKGNFANPRLRQGLHPDVKEPYPKGPHFDWHFTRSRKKLSIRRTSPGFEWWNPDVEQWQELLPEMLPELIE